MAEARAVVTGAARDGGRAGKASVWGVVRKCFDLIGREHRRRWIGLVVLAVVASGLEMLGALLVFLLLALVADPGAELALPIVGDLRRLAGDIDETTLLVGMAVVMGLFFVVRAAVQTGVTYAQHRVAHNAGARLANRLAAGYLTLPYAFHLQRNTSDLIRNANPAVMTVVAQAFVPIIRVTADAILTVGLLAVMVVVSPVATVIAVVVVGGAGGLLLAVVQPRLKHLGKVTHRENQATLLALQQPLHGLRDIKLLGRERFFARQYAGSRGRLARATYLRATATELPRHVMETALIGFILVFFVLAVVAGTATDEVLSVLGLFAYAGLRLQPSLNRIISGLNELKYATAAVDEVHQELRLVEHAAVPPEDDPPRPFRDGLVMDGVSFRYEGADQEALRDVDLTIRPHETLGICGTTGSGKTTLVDLLTGLLEPTGGRVLVDGQDLRDDPRGWQRNLGVVPQMVFLIDDTLRRNIALGVPDEDIDEDAVREAIRLAQIDDFVARSPDGLDTVVGERGVRISGGQRQRIAIARALYQRASVLVFDEGTSALDNTTEAQLMGALDGLRGGYTIILVAHRLSTVRDCDRIVFVEGGRVTGLDTYDNLVSANEGFRALAQQ